MNPAWAQRGFDNGLSICRIILLMHDERLYLDRRDQAHIVSQLLELAIAAMGRGASLYGNDALLVPGKECKHLTPGKLIAKHNRPVLACSVQLENAICQINADDANFRHDVLSFCDGFNNHQIGTLRCRQ